ncbi:hypothetical protein [uncultured Bradyrhizobium sp.]|uniref:hypothetical protein n=1 Tax=uncultured Bradyrhizobium sp. TaxID=199684 RepID=UPI0035CA117C
MPTPTDYLLVAQAAYTTYNSTPVSPNGWSLLKYEYATDTGMMGAAFKNNATVKSLSDFKELTRSQEIRRLSLPNGKPTSRLALGRFRMLIGMPRPLLDQ